MRPRPGDSPQKSGRRWERIFASIFGVEPQKGSGNRWTAKLDVADSAITWSLKFTTHRTFTLTKEALREADRAVYDNGDNSIPGLAIAFDDGSETVVILRAADFVRLLSLEQSLYIAPSKADQKRRIAGIPSLLRDES